MKRMLVIAVALFFLLPAIAQQKDYLRLPIEKAVIDGVDCSDYYKSVNGFLSFYHSNKGPFCMANVMPAKESQSFGEITDREKKSFKDALNGKEVYILDFLWYYNNDYDDNYGVAKCHLNLSPAKTGYVYSFEMVTDKGETLCLSGGNIESITTLLENW